MNGEGPSLFNSVGSASAGGGGSRLHDPEDMNTLTAVWKRGVSHRGSGLGGAMRVGGRASEYSTYLATLLTCSLYLLVPAALLICFVHAVRVGEVPEIATALGSIMGSVANGARYAAVSTVLQVVIGLCVALTFTINKHELGAKSRFGRQMALDAFVVFPYLLPSVCWRWISDSVLGVDNGLLGYLVDNAVVAEPWVSYIDCHVTSVFHLYPFSYLVFRFFFSSIDARQVAFGRTVGLRGGAFTLRYYGLDFLRICLIVSMLRLAIMFGKFDLPYLFSGGQSREGSLLYTLPLWVDHQVRTEGLAYAGTVVAALFIISVSVLLPAVGIARLCRGTSHDLGRALIRLLIRGHGLIANYLPRRLRRACSYACAAMVRCIGLFFGAMGSALIIWFSVKHLTWSAVCGVWQQYGYVDSLAVTFGSLPAIALAAMAAALCVRVAMAGHHGWGIVLVTWASLAYFATPPAVYLSFSIVSGRGHPWLTYCLFLLASILPLAICQLVAGVPRLSDASYLYLRKLEVSFPVAFARVHRTQIAAVLPMAVLAVVVVLVNDLFGAQHLLREPPYPLSRYLWNSRNTFHNDLGLALAATLPVLAVNAGILTVAVLAWRGIGRKERVS